MLIQYFSTENKAFRFATQCGGTISIEYDWDNVKNKMVKYYVVKYMKGVFN